MLIGLILVSGTFKKEDVRPKLNLRSLLIHRKSVSALLPKSSMNFNLVVVAV